VTGYKRWKSSTYTCLSSDDPMHSHVQPDDLGGLPDDRCQVSAVRPVIYFIFLGSWYTIKWAYGVSSNIT